MKTCEDCGMDGTAVDEGEEYTFGDPDIVRYSSRTCQWLCEECNAAFFNNCAEDARRSMGTDY